MGRSMRPSEDQTVTTAIAIDKDKNSHSAVKWALDNILNKKHICILVHIRNPTANPLDAKGSRTSTEVEVQQLFLPYRGFCARKGVEPKEVILHSIEVSSTLLNFISNNAINNIVVGASTRNAFTKNFRKLDVPSSLAKNAPEFCTVYVIAKGKVQFCRSATQACTPIIPRQPSQMRLSPNFQPHSQVSEEFSRSSISESWKSVQSDRSSVDSSTWATYSGSKIPSPSPPRSTETMYFSTRTPPRLSCGDSLSATSASGYSETSGFLSSDISSDNLDYSYADAIPMNSIYSHVDLDAEMNKLRLELKQNVEMYHAVCKADQRVKPDWEMELHQWKMEELQAQKFEEANKFSKKDVSPPMTMIEKLRSKAAMEALHMSHDYADYEVRSSTSMEMKARSEAGIRKKVKETVLDSNAQYKIYKLEEIEAATDHFSSSLKIGEGGYGPVYQAILDDIVVAIKVLRSDISQGEAQFQQEVEVLGGMRHPNMVLLVGACAQYGCLVYEYMENGSLEDRLFRKNNTPPIPWKTRFKIASEISNALLFLHETKPEPLVHRDLKPANILLDSNYMSKISDVGLARLVPASVADSVTQYHMTAAAGTFCYIDPEYQQTGLLGVKSDVYSLGVMLLQIITAKPPMGLTHQVERAIETGKFASVLDQTVTGWPIEETLSYAKLALKCCELRKKDRPDLRSVVVPELNRLRNLGMNGDAVAVYSCNSYEMNSYPGSIREEFGGCSSSSYSG